jgi:hypothetical protein
VVRMRSALTRKWLGHPRRWRADVTWATKVGVAYAGVFAAMALVGAIVAPLALRARFGTTLIQVLGAYLGMGIAFGLVVGTLRPLGKYLAGRMLMGFLVILPLALWIEFWVIPKHKTSSFKVISAAAIALIMGCSYGAATWSNRSS